MMSFGIITNYFFNFDYWFLFCLVIGLFLLLFILRYKLKKSWKTSPSFGVTTYVFALSLGMLLQHFHYEPNEKNHYSNFLHLTEKNVVKGVIKENLKPTKKNTKHIVRVKEINNKKASGKLIVYISKSEKNLLPGDEIVFVRELQNTPNNFNPFQFDYGSYLKKQNIFHLVYLKKGDFVKTKHLNNWDSFWNVFKSKLIASFYIHRFNPENQSIINSLLFGERKFIDQEIVTAYANAGIMHILAISGLHVGILYIFLLTVLKPLKKINYKRIKILELFIILLVLWGFATLTGLSASVTRAVTMFTIIAIGNYLNRNSNIYNTIATSAFILLLFNPNFIFDVGFQLSYAAVLSIVAFQPFFKHFYFYKSKVLKFVTDLLLVSFVAQIGVLPLSLYYFNQFPVLFLFANIIVIPLTIVILWTSFATLVLNFLFPVLSIEIGRLITFCIENMNGYARWISGFEHLIIKNISFNEPLCFLSYIIICLFLVMINKPHPKKTNYFLLSIIIFQMGYLGIKYLHSNEDELTFFNSKKTLISIKQQGRLTFFTNDVEENYENINHYKRGNFFNQSKINTLGNIYSFKGKRILIIDSLYYPMKQNPDIVFITNNSSINLERIIDAINPKIIIADNSNPFYKIEKWQSTCKKRKIPFHATAEKGFYRLK